VENVDAIESAHQQAPKTKIYWRISVTEKMNAAYDAGEKKIAKESNTDRPHYILLEESVALRSGS
jgi:hypothetical protein